MLTSELTLIILKNEIVRLKGIFLLMLTLNYYVYCSLYIIDIYVFPIMITKWILCLPEDKTYLFESNNIHEYVYLR